MRTTADDKDGDSSCASCVVDSLIEKESNETVGVNNCVNISSNSYDETSNDDNNFLLSDRFADECLAAELDDAKTSTITADDAAMRLRNIHENILTNFTLNNNDDDDDDDSLTSSKYSEVTSRCEVLQPSTSSTTSAPANDDVVVSSHYASTRDNNRKHQKAVRKNFSLWIGVTSCVWGLLLLLMKNYAD